jgi:hypothetical protein
MAPIIAIGIVVSDEPVEPQELSRPDMKGWLFPHNKAHIVATEIIKANSGYILAPGDTITITYVSGKYGEDPSKPDIYMGISSLRGKHLEPGAAGVFALRFDQGEWMIAGYSYIHQDSEINAIHAVAAEHSVETWIESSPTILVVDTIEYSNVVLRKLSSGAHPECLFPHQERRACVLEVLKNQTLSPVAVGDTISFIYPCNDFGRNPNRPGMIKPVEGVSKPNIPILRRVVVALRLERSVWLTGPLHHFRPEFDIDTIRDAINEQEAEEMEEVFES